MAQLAQRLNDLAVANSNGLLNDDEYRLLRQNAFEEHSANAVIPTEVPLVPITACLDVHVRVHATIPEPPPIIHPPVRPKVNVSVGVANLLSKASGRRTPKLVRDPPLTPRDGRKPSSPGHTSPSGSLKLSVMIPKLLYKKPSDPRSTETPRPLADALNAFHAKGHFKLPPISIPTPRRNLARSSAANPNKSTTSLRLDVPHACAASIRAGDEDIGIFSEDSLSSSSAIRSTIAATEEELRTLVDAFQMLETRTCRRIQKQNAHRLPTNTPASVDILLEGREWREHRLVPLLSPSSSYLLDSASHRHLFVSPTTDSPTSDRTSVHSASSHNTNLSRARSISSLSRISHSKSTPGPVSTGSPRFTGLVRLPPKTHSTLPRKSSISSTTSSFLSKSCNSHHSHTHDMSLRPAGLQAVNNNLSTSVLSQSKSHLGLKKLKGSSRMFSQETLMSYSTCTSSEEGSGGHAGSGNSGCGGGGGSSGSNTCDENDPELVEVRKRREELVARYNARLEFLRAKLKGAELHERLLRR